MQICNFLSEFTTFFTQKIIRKKKMEPFFWGGTYFFLTLFTTEALKKVHKNN